MVNARQGDGIGKRLSAAIGRFLDDRGTAWGFGILMPAIMLLLDPVVFRGGTMGFEQAILGQYRTSCHLGIGSLSLPW